VDLFEPITTGLGNLTADHSSDQIVSMIAGVRIGRVVRKFCLPKPLNETASMEETTCAYLVAGSGL